VHWGELTELSPPTGVRSVWLCLDPRPQLSADDLDERIAALRQEGLSVKQIARTLAEEVGRPAREIYRRATEQSGR